MKRQYLILGLLVLAFLSGCKSQDYKEAQALLEAQQYDEAIIAFEALGDYKSSAFYLEDAKDGKLQKQLSDAQELILAEQYDEAIVALEAIDNETYTASYMEDAKSGMAQAQLTEVVTLYESGDLSGALALYDEIENLPEDLSMLEAMEDEVATFQAVYDIYLRWQTAFDEFEPLTRYNMDQQYADMKAISDDFNALDLSAYPELSAYRADWYVTMYGIEELYKLDVDMLADFGLNPLFHYDLQFSFLQSGDIYKDFINRGLEVDFPERYAYLIVEESE